MAESLFCDDGLDRLRDDGVTKSASGPMEALPSSDDHLEHTVSRQNAATSWGSGRRGGRTVDGEAPGTVSLQPTVFRQTGTLVRTTTSSPHRRAQVVTASGLRSRCETVPPRDALTERYRYELRKFLPILQTLPTVHRPRARRSRPGRQARGKAPLHAVRYGNRSAAQRPASPPRLIGR